MPKDEFDILGDEVLDLTRQLDQANKVNDVSLEISLKKQIYSKKLKQLELLESLDAISSTVSAKELDEDVRNRKKVPLYQTGTPLDDSLGGGIEVGTFIQIAGESFSGKTHLVLEILSNISGYAQVLFFNFEMGDRRINQRLNKLLISTQQEENFLVNSKARRLGDIITEINNKASDGVKFFGIDSKMKIEVPEEQEDLKAFRKISHELSKLAQQQEIIILLINQMNEEDQKNNRLAFKGGGDQMYDTDIALFYLINKKGKEPSQWTRTLHCRKNRTVNENLFRLDLVLDMHNKTKILQKETE